MKNEEKFITFLEGLKTEKTQNLIESVKKGFDSIFEAEEVAVPTKGIQIFNADEVSSMGENGVKRFVAKELMGFGATEEEAAKVLVAKYGVEPYGSVQTPNGYVAFYNGEE